MKSPAALRVLIVGGGIAGLAAGVALRSENRDITILEQSSLNKEAGACISLQPNATKIATKLGLDPFLAPKKPMEDKAFQILNVTGQVQQVIPLSSARYGASRVLFHRVDLHDALKSAATSPDLPGNAARILTSSRVISCNCEEGIVVLSSGDTLRADLIIGADGIHSVLRSFVTGCEDTPKPTGVSAFRILVESRKLANISSISSVLDVREPRTTMVVGHDRRLILGPARGGQIFGAVFLVPDNVSGPNPTAQSWNTPVPKETVMRHLQDFPLWIQDIFRFGPDDVVLYQLRDLDPLTTWTKGRCILIGDAAHAMLPTQGQGASQSFEDAEALQVLLKDLTGNSTFGEICACLQEVMDVRYERASLIQSYSRKQAERGTEKGSTQVLLNPAQFMDYNCEYEGAMFWRERQRNGLT